MAFGKRKRTRSRTPFARSNVRRKLAVGPLRRRRRGTGRGVARVAKNVMMNLAENKVRDRATPITPGALSSYYHNSIYFNTLHNNNDSEAEHAYPTSLVQGDENYQRNGREIYSTGFRVRGLLDIPFDRRNTTVKIYKMEFNSNQGSVQDLFHTGVGTTGNKLLDRLNTERFPGSQLLRTLRVTARDLYVERGDITDGGSIATLKYDIWIPWKRKLSYKSAVGKGPTGGCKEIMGLAFVFYDAAETLITDAVCTRNEQLVSWYFKDP